MVEMLVILDFIRWTFFSWHGAMGRGREHLDPQIQLGFTVVKHPLLKRHCTYCKVVYWTYKDKNKYCGRFSCFRRMIHSENK